MENNKVKIAAVVLSAGFSRRMGEFKPLLPVQGKPALLNVIEAFKEAGVAEVFVVTGYRREDLSALIENAGAKEVFNSGFADGMFSSVKAGIKAVMSGADSETETAGILLHPVDTSLVGASTIKAFFEAVSAEKDKGQMFAVACFQGKKGHPLFIPAGLFDEILKHEGGRGLKEITSKYDDVMFRFETGDESVILDMDTKKAYEEMLEFHKRTENIQNRLNELIKNRRIVLIRHGEIKQHADKIFLGQYDPPLSDRGRQEACEAANYLAGLALPFDRIYTSDLKRASETAEIIARQMSVITSYYSGMTIIPEPGLREMSLGSWDGRFISEIMQEYPEQYARRGENLLTFKIDNESENYYDLRYRVQKSLLKILEQDDSVNLPIVSHGGTIRALLSILKNVSMEETLKIPVKNGEIIILEG